VDRPEIERSVERLRGEIGRVIVGMTDAVDLIVVALLSEGHVLLEGPPGTAKTLLARTLARTLGLEFRRIQFTPDLMPADILGTNLFDFRTSEFTLTKGPIFTQFLLADEINRAPPKTQSALLQAMQERVVTLDGTSHSLGDGFLVVATQNPIEHEGTYPLPEAQVDRFMLKVVVTYPSRVEEREIIERMAHPDVVIKARQVTSLAQIVEARGWVDKVYMDPKITEYILDLVFASRGAEKAQLSERQAEADLGGLAGLIQYGASPRAALALALAAKARGFMDGRAYVVPQDVKDVAPAVLRHRIIPTYEAEAENLTTDDLVRRLLDELRTP